MSYEMKDGQASLFKITQKEKESQPDFKGKAMIEGKLFYLSFWSRKTEAGNLWLSGTIQPANQSSPASESEKEEFLQPAAISEPDSAATPADNEGNSPPPEDDLPF